MANKKTVRKVKKSNPNLRLVKNNDLETEKRKGGRKEKLRFSKSKRMVILSVTLLLLLFVLVGGYVYIIQNYTVTTVYVEGNVHYTNEEIIEMVMGGRLGSNSLFLSLKYKDKGMEDIPFIQTMDVEIEAKDTIRIIVYEKALAGYVSYLGRYVYFDKDGIVVETSTEETEGIPQVTGLSFDHVILHEPLPVEKTEVFNEILNITQQLERYSMSADRIYFDPSYQVTLMFGEAKVALGDDRYIDEKIMKLQYILPDLLGKEGTLNMREYSEDTKSYSFELD
ncbi:MAG: cell division protein FtsQ [Lachnospiraceae bacterium]|nr:cell division protein FtsQ [Lachnospiraceae bacterium]MBD5523152.1 cell division protein FtsQ [Lachnospiraceae bacterium]